MTDLCPDFEFSFEHFSLHQKLLAFDMTSTAPLETDAGDKARDVLRRFNFERVLSEGKD
jgi:hypothetical protein